MATSQNGWIVIDSLGLDRSPIPGTNVVPVPGVRAGDVATVLLHVGKLFNERVAPVYNPGCWGWAPPTAIPGSTVYSNHGSGTAIDLNAPSFPWKMYRMSPMQRAACRQIASELAPAVTWGGDFPTFVDEMHFEINSEASVEDVAIVAQRIRQGGGLKGAPSTPTTSTGDSDVITNKDAHILRIISSEVKGWDFDSVHRGDTDARELNAWVGQPWTRFIQEGWLEKPSESFRNKRIAAINYYDHRRPQVEAEITNMQTRIDQLARENTTLSTDLHAAKNDQKVALLEATIEDLKLKLAAEQTKHETPIFEPTPTPQIPAADRPVPTEPEAPSEPKKPSPSLLTRVLMWVLSLTKKK